jgi:hypothetical protein
MLMVWISVCIIFGIIVLALSSMLTPETKSNDMTAAVCVPLNVRHSSVWLVVVFSKRFNRSQSIVTDCGRWLHLI